MNTEALYKRIEQLEAENLELRKQLLAMQKKVIGLEHRLLAYENAHTPPSLSKKSASRKNRVENSVLLKGTQNGNGNNLSQQKLSSTSLMPARIATTN